MPSPPRCSPAPRSPVTRSIPSSRPPRPGWRPTPRRSTRCARGTSIRPTGNGRLFAFRHPLLRCCVYDLIPPARRLDAHERAAAALAARGAGLAAQAYHVERCGRAGDPAATALLRDAAAAVVRTAPATAARWYEAALRLLGDEPAVRRRAARVAGARARRRRAVRRGPRGARRGVRARAVARRRGRVRAGGHRARALRRRAPAPAARAAPAAGRARARGDRVPRGRPDRPHDLGRARAARDRRPPRPARRRARAVRAGRGLDRRARPRRHAPRAGDRDAGRRARRASSPRTRAPPCTSPPRSCCSCAWRTAERTIERVLALGR